VPELLPGQGLATAEDVVEEQREVDHRAAGAQPSHVDERAGAEVLGVAGRAGRRLAREERRRADRARRRAVHLVERRAEARPLQGVQHARDVGAAHAATADDERDPVVVEALARCAARRPALQEHA